MTVAKNQFAGRGAVEGVANWFFARYSRNPRSATAGKPPPLH